MHAVDSHAARKEAKRRAHDVVHQPGVGCGAATNLREGCAHKVRGRRHAHRGVADLAELSGDVERRDDFNVDPLALVPI